MKKDYFIVSIIGFFFGLLLLPVLKNIELPFLAVNIKSGAVVVAGFVIFANFALWVAYLIGRQIPVILQFAKFGAVGALGTLLDLGVLNTLIALTGAAAGYAYVGFKGISFIVAALNSYFFNRYWTFGISESASIKEFGQFFLVGAIGLILNTAIASLVVNYIGSPADISLERWANVGALVATIASFLWNFLGYKFLVFKNS